MRIRKSSTALDYLAANARISYQQPPLKRSPTVVPSTIHSPPPLHLTQKAETPIVPRYNRGRCWRDLLTSLNSDEVKSEDPTGGNVTIKTTRPRNLCDARKYVGVEGQDANGSAEVIDGEGSTKVRRNRKARGKIVEEERDRLRVGTSVSSSADIHEEDDDDGEVSERKMKKKKKSLKSLHGVLDEYHHQYVESPQCCFPSTSTSCANGVAEY